MTYMPSMRPAKPDFIGIFLQKILKTTGIDTDFILTRVAYPDSSDVHYRIMCRVCNCLHEQILCDWADSFDLDSLAKMVLDFGKQHKHDGTIDEGAGETGRKFR